MLDKSLPYKTVIMRLPADAARPEPPCLPEGYSIRTYRPGDGQYWAEIEASVLEFESADRALGYFERDFLPFEAELGKRMCFVCGPDGKPAATAAAWYADCALGCREYLHWVAVKPELQGMGLGRAAVAAALSRAGAGEVWLATQTWSWKAIALYASMGFRAVREEKMIEYLDGRYFFAENQTPEALALLRGRLDEKILAALEENML